MNINDYMRKKRDDFIKYKKQGTYTCYFSDIDKNLFSFTYVSKTKIAYHIEYQFLADKEVLVIRNVKHIHKLGGLSWGLYHSGPVKQMISQMDGFINAVEKERDNDN